MVPIFAVVLGAVRRTRMVGRIGIGELNFQGCSGENLQVPGSRLIMNGIKGHPCHPVCPEGGHIEDFDPGGWIIGFGGIKVLIEGKFPDGLVFALKYGFLNGNQGIVQPVVN